jgi:hypothetical protein
VRRSLKHNVEYRAQLSEYLRVGEANDADTTLFQVLGALAIVNQTLMAEVSRPVDFNGQSLRRAVEVQDIGAERILAAELHPLQLSGP